MMDKQTIIQFRKTYDSIKNIALFKRENGDFEGCLSLLLDVEKNQKSSVEIYSDIAACYFDLGLHVLSLNYWFKYLTVCPEGEYARAYNAIGSCFYMMGQNELADEYFEKRIALADKTAVEYDDVMFESIDVSYDDDLSQYYVCYPKERMPKDKIVEQARIYIEEEQYEKAKELLQYVKKGDSQYKNAVLSLAFCHFKAGDEDKALSILSDYAQEFPDDKNGTLNLVGLLTAMRKNDQLGEYFAKIKDYKVNTAEDYFKLAVTCIQAKREDDAEFFLKKSVELDSYYLNSQHFLAICEFNKKDYESAKRRFLLYYNVTHSVVAKYYLKLTTDTLDKKIPHKKLKFSNNIPNGAIKEYENFIAKILDGKKAAYKRCDKTKFFDVLEWIYMFRNHWQEDVLLTFLSFFTPKIRQFYCKLLLDVAVSDLIKTKIITLLCEYASNKTLYYVYRGKFRKIKLFRPKLIGDKADLFHCAFSVMMGVMAFILPESTKQMSKDCELVFYSLNIVDEVVHFDNLTALSCVLALRNPFLKEDSLPMLIELFDADAETVDRYVEIFKKNGLL